MTLLTRFLDPSSVSLKICGVTLREDAERLVEFGVDALGVNFWPHSKRYIAPQEVIWLSALAGQILRVGVFVNQEPDLPLRLIREGLLDAVQLHGDETPEDAEIYRIYNVPLIKAIGVRTPGDLQKAGDFDVAAILLDTHAPGVYGGTGEAFDWNAARDFKVAHPTMPLVLAGGITPQNAALSVSSVRPAALDVASGAELTPGIKDFAKVAALIAALSLISPC